MRTLIVAILVLTPRLSVAQIVPGVPFIGPVTGGTTPVVGNITAKRFNCTQSATPIAVTATTTLLPSTTCLTVITTSDAAYTLASPGGITAGTINGQQLRVMNASGNVITLNSGSANIVGSAGTITLTIQGGSQDFEWLTLAGPAWLPVDGNAYDTSALVTGTLPVSRGGTGAATVMGTLYGSGTSAVAAVAGTTTTVLHGNAAGPPSYSGVSLTADVSGVLPAANGGNVAIVPTYTTATTVTIPTYAQGNTLSYNLNPAGATAVTLPDCTLAIDKGVTWSIKNLSTQTITVSPAAGTIDGAASVVMNTQYQALSYQCGNGAGASDSNWTLR